VATGVAAGGHRHDDPCQPVIRVFCGDRTRYMRAKDLVSSVDRAHGVPDAVRGAIADSDQCSSLCPP
jgi:hypothetical protein